MKKTQKFNRVRRIDKREIRAQEKFFRDGPKLTAKEKRERLADLNAACEAWLRIVRANIDELAASEAHYKAAVNTVQQAEMGKF